MDMQPVYIYKFEGYACVDKYLLLSNKSFDPKNTFYQIIYYHYRLNYNKIYIDEQINITYFNKFNKYNFELLETIVPINRSKNLGLNSFYRISFNQLLILINDFNRIIYNPFTPNHSDLRRLLQLVLSKWDDWN
jgi:hypothetical protein